MNDWQNSTSSSTIFPLLVVLVVDDTSRTLWRLPSAQSLKSASVSQIVAFEITAFLALKIFFFPSLVFVKTPVASSSPSFFSTKISSQCVLKRKSPPYFSNPLTKQSTSAPDPPIGNSNAASGAYQSANMSPISAPIVAFDVPPDNKKQSKSM